MKIKRIFSIFLTCVILLSILSTASFAVDKKLMISVDSVTANPGNEVSVSIHIINNPGIIAAKINVAFDEGLTLIGTENGNVFPKSMAFTPPRQLSTVRKITGNCNFAWQGVDIAKKDIKDGVILTLHLKVADYIKEGRDYKITVTSRELDIVDRDLRCYKLDDSCGSVRINEHVPSLNRLKSLFERLIDFIRKVMEKNKRT